MNYKKILFILGCGLALSLGKADGQSATFNYTGSTQTWTVPCGVTSITVDMAGAQGGSVSNLTLSPTTAAGGLGGRVQCTLPVTGGAVLQINVGGQGESDGLTLSCQVSTGGWNGGGTGYGGYNSYNYNAGGGGGASSILQTPYSCANTMVNAGGGGGAACSGCTGGGVVGGVGGGLIGGTGGYGACQNAAYGGTQSAGGAAATYFGAAAAGSACTGGNGSPTGGVTCGGGGGGGGGYYGGGGGSLSGGGGGSSYTMAGASNITHTQGYQTGNGYATITWTGGAGLTASASVTTSISCNGGSNGSASSTVTGGGLPYTYSWTGGGTNSTVSGLTAGSYTLTVHDACGNSASASVSITQPTSIIVTAYPLLNDSCNGDDDGSAMSSVSGGSMPYTYAWTGGGTKDSIVGLTAGTYSLNIQDANGCTGSATVTITQPNILMVSDSVTANVLCNGDSTGSASSTVSGGTMPYMYLWTGGGTTDTAVGWTAGSYTLTVRDAYGCSGSAMVTITQPTAIVVVEHTTPDNGSGNGTASVNVSGGVSPYTYAWTGGNTTDSISGKAKGAYCCTVTDANGCVANVCDTIKSTAGVNEIASNGEKIVVYPNPNNGEFTIESSLNAVSVVEVYNVLGEKVFTGNLNSGNNTINMTSQQNGVYLYRVMSESGTLLSEGKITLQK